MLYAVSSTRMEFCVYFFCYMKDDGSVVLKALRLRDFPGSARRNAITPSGCVAKAVWGLMRSALQQPSLFEGAASKRGCF